MRAGDVIAYSSYRKFLLSPPAFELRLPPRRAPTGPLQPSERVTWPDIFRTPHDRYRVFSSEVDVTGILIDYARFVEVQQRRARVDAELGRTHQPPASPTRLAPIAEPVQATRRLVSVDRKIGPSTADVR